MIRLVVMALCARGAWGIFADVQRAQEIMRKAPWPAPRQTPEPTRLRLVRGGRVFDWERDGAA